MKTKMFILVGALLVIGMSAGIPRGAWAQGQSGTSIHPATVSCEVHYTKTFAWTIDKSVEPATWDLFRGDSGTSQYTIAVTKDSGTEAAWIDGQVQCTNNGVVATEGLAISVVLTNPSGKTIFNTAAVDVSSNPVLDPGETGSYAYRVDMPEADITPGATYKVTANITITNHSGHLGAPFGPSPSDTAILPADPTPVNDSINVDDTNGGSWAFSSSGSVNYTKTFTAEDDKGTHDNTATIRETKQSDSASVTVNCYALEVTKNASTAFDRTYTWTIDKTGDKESLTLATGEPYPVNYSVEVGATHTDSNWAVKGDIEVKNPAPIPATINSVSDIISGDIAPSVYFGVTFPYTLAAGGTLTGTYTAILPDASNRTNTATATLQNYRYDYQLNPTSGGTTNFTGTADVDFSKAAITEIDECIDVSDDHAGALGTVCIGDAPKTFTYSLNIGPYDVCGNYEFMNVASFVTNDTGATGSGSWTVKVSVPCSGGCTLSQGYWKTHSKYGPAPYDETWAQIGEDTTFFLSGQSYYDVLWTNPKGGNAYYILAHQYIAAELNNLNEADFSAAQAAFDAAKTLFNAYTPAQVAALKGNSAVRKQFIDLATTLENYSTGVIGPGHCDESSGDAGVSKPAIPGAEESALPAEFGMQANPNPFNPSTTITFTLPEPGRVTLKVYNMLGHEVASLVDKSVSAGKYSVDWNARGMASGIYFCRIQAGSNATVKKIMLLK